MKYILELDIRFLELFALSLSINNPIYVFKKAREEVSGPEKQ